MPLIRHSSTISVEMLPGVVRRTLNAGERTMLIEVSLAEGAIVPWHTHPHEQVGYLASGRLRFEPGGGKAGAHPGRLLAGALQPTPPGHRPRALPPRRYLLATAGGVPLTTAVYPARRFAYYRPVTQ